MLSALVTVCFVQVLCFTEASPALYPTIERCEQQGHILAGMVIARSRIARHNPHTIQVECF